MIGLGLLESIHAVDILNLLIPTTRMRTVYQGVPGGYISREKSLG